MEQLISWGLPFAKGLIAFIRQFLDVRKSKGQFLSAIREEIEMMEDSSNRIIEFDESVKKVLDSIGARPTLHQLDEIMKYSAESMLLFSNLLSSYILYSIAVKEFSVNEYMMDNLKKYKGVLYDYVMRISETVLDDNTVLIGGNYFRFLKANKKGFLPKMSKKESKQLIDEERRYIDIVKKKVLPNIAKKKPRSLFRPKRIKIIFREPLLKLVENKERIKIENPEEIKQIIDKSSPLFFIYDEILAIEDMLLKREKLPYRKRGRVRS